MFSSLTHVYAPPYLHFLGARDITSRRGRLPPTGPRQTQEPASASHGSSLKTAAGIVLQPPTVRGLFRTTHPLDTHHCRHRHFPDYSMSHHSHRHRRRHRASSKDKKKPLKPSKEVNPPPPPPPPPRQTQQPTWSYMALDVSGSFAYDALQHPNGQVLSYRIMRPEVFSNRPSAYSNPRGS